MVKKIILFGLGFLPLLLKAQLVLNAQLPAAGFVQKDQLWNLILVNNNADILDVTIQMDLQDVASGQVVLSASTGNFLTNKDLVFMDSAGKIFNKAAVDFRIIRSGKRNNLGLTVSTVTSAVSPIKIHKPWFPIFDSLVIDNNSRVVAASAIEYKEKWQTDGDVFTKFKTVYTADTSTANIIVNGDFSQGYTGFGTDFWLSGNCVFFPTYKHYNVCDGGAPHGNQMGFNGFSQIAWQQSPTVFPNRDYTFSVSFFNGNNENIPTIEISINNVLIAPVFALQPIGWQTFSFQWNSGNATTVVIKIKGFVK